MKAHANPRRRRGSGGDGQRAARDQTDHGSGDAPARGDGGRERPRGVAVCPLARHRDVPRRRQRVVQHVRPQPLGRAPGGVQGDLPRAARRVRPAAQGDHHRVLLPPHPRGGGADGHRSRGRRPRGRAGGRAEGPAAGGDRALARPARRGGRRSHQRPRRAALAPLPPPPGQEATTTGRGSSTCSTRRRRPVPRSTSSRRSATPRTGRPRSCCSSACICTTAHSSS